MALTLAGQGISRAGRWRGANGAMKSSAAFEWPPCASSLGHARATDITAAIIQAPRMIFGIRSRSQTKLSTTNITTAA